MQSIGVIENISIDYDTRLPKITLVFENKGIFEQAGELRNDRLSIEIKRYRKKRSLDANAYFWELTGEISKATDVPKDVIYKDAIRNIGAYTVIPTKDEAVDRFIEIWTSKGLGWLCDTTKSKLEGFTNVLAYHGSSVYDTKEMARLIDVIVQECQQLNIETKTPEELESLKQSWGK